MAENFLTPDQEALVDLREFLTELRTKRSTSVEKLDSPPLHVAGCDDPNGRFDWYRISEDDGTVVGYFHAPRGVEL